MKPRILVIVGPTASGKTSLSIELAKQCDGEVISADSRQVYRGLNLGTGKIMPEEMQDVSHHLLDVVNPDETYTVADFVRDGRKAIDDILSRGKLPIVVGGTFFYIDALLGRISTPEVPPNEALREHLETLSAEELFTLLKEKDSVRAHTIDKDNRRRLIRALEIVEALGVVPDSVPEEKYNTLTLGIAVNRDTLQNNIHERLTQRLNAGMIEEVKNLHAQGLSFTRMCELGIEYTYIAKYLLKEISEEEMLQLIERKSLQYAKRQMTWLKRDKNIVWIDPKDTNGIHSLVVEFLG